MNTKENNPNSPLNAAKTLNSEGEGNHTTKLEKAIVGAFLPYMGTIQTNDMAIIDASHYLLNGIRCQLELFRSITGEVPAREEIQVMAGSMSGFSDGLINQLDALEALLTDGLIDQIRALEKQRDQALEALSFVEEEISVGGVA